MWQKKVQEDLERLVSLAEESFKTPGVIVGYLEKDNRKSKYMIRMANGDVGLYPRKVLGDRDLHTGLKIKNKLPKPETIVSEPDLAVFIFEVLKEQVNLVPRLWLRTSVTKILEGGKANITKPFNEWVLLPVEKRGDTKLIELLEKAVEYEGLKGLVRYNDQNQKG
jgi:hypothetical protein